MTAKLLCLCYETEFWSCRLNMFRYALELISYHRHLSYISVIYYRTW